MKTMVTLPLVVIALAAGGYAIARGLGHAVMLRELGAAAMIALIAAEAACVPNLLSRGGDAASISQAALGGTVIHLLLCFGLVAGMWMVGVKLEARPFMLWLMLFYWGTLAVVVSGMAAMIAAAGKGQRGAISEAKR